MKRTPGKTGASASISASPPATPAGKQLELVKAEADAALDIARRHHPRQYRNARGQGGFDNLLVEAGRDDERGTEVERAPQLLAVKHSAGTDKHVAACGNALDRGHSTLVTQRHLEHRQAAGDKAVGEHIGSPGVVDGR